MKILWTYIEKMKWCAETKYKVTLLIIGVLFSIIGCAVWLIIRNWALSTWDWVICFIGYPIVISWFIVFLYSCKHDFHDGAFYK